MLPEILLDIRYDLICSAGFPGHDSNSHGPTKWGDFREPGFCQKSASTVLRP